MTDPVSPVSGLLEKLLAQPGVELLEHRVGYDEYAMVGAGRARIRLQWHHQRSMSTITPDWCADVRHTTFAYAVACYVAGDVVEPLPDVEGEVDFMVGHVDVIRAICEDEDSWAEFCRTTDRLLGLSNVRELPQGGPDDVWRPLSGYVAILESFPGVEVVDVPSEPARPALLRYGHVLIEVGPRRVRFWPHEFSSGVDAVTLEEFALAASPPSAAAGRGLFSEVEYARAHLKELDAACSSAAAWHDFSDVVRRRR